MKILQVRYAVAHFTLQKTFNVNLLWRGHIIFKQQDRYLRMRNHV